MDIKLTKYTQQTHTHMYAIYGIYDDDNDDYRKKYSFERMNQSKVRALRPIFFHFQHFLSISFFLFLAQHTCASPNN